MKDAKKGQTEPPLKGPAKPTKGDDEFLDDPNSELKKAIAANGEAYIAETAAILDTDEEIRNGVFRELHKKQRADLEKAYSDSEQSPVCQSIWTTNIDLSCAETKKKMLETIRAQILGLQGQIDQNKNSATKLMRNAVRYAKEIGDRLLYVKQNLLKHGEYEDWVEDNFDGELSTARAYTRIAQFQNWKRIAPKLFSAGGLTIEEALALIRKRPPEKEKSDSRKEIFMEMLVGCFRRRIYFWPIKPLYRLAYDLEFMGLVEEAAKVRNAELRPSKKKESAKDNEDAALEKIANSEEFHAVLRKRLNRRPKD